MFRDKVNEVKELGVPKLAISERVNGPWFTLEVNRSLNKNKRAYQKVVKTSDPHDWLKYKSTSSVCTDAIHKAKKLYNCKLPNLSKTEPKKIWNINNLRKTTRPHSSKVLMAMQDFTRGRMR